MSDDRILVPAGLRLIGSDTHYPEERPARQVEVAAFRLDRCPVSVEAFAAFVEETDYCTTAERRGHSAVFVMSAGPVDLQDPAGWWRVAPGVSWRAALDQGKLNHPVTHVSRQDAETYARWRGARLPSELEWESAARLGHPAGPYAWGDRFAPQGQLMANVWTGAFPWHFARPGAPGPSPIGAYPATAAGFFDLIGNVWEWTSSVYGREATCGCGPASARESPALAALKGGSFLCAGEYCARYRPSARIGVAPDMTTAHIGFRCAHDA